MEEEDAILRFRYFATLGFFWQVAGYLVVLAFPIVFLVDWVDDRGGAWLIGWNLILFGCYSLCRWNVLRATDEIKAIKI